MFSSKSKDNAPPPLTIGPAPIPAKRIGRSGSVPSIVSADLVVAGTLNTSGDMQIDGKVEGDVRSASLVIGERAEVRGQIWSEDVTVRGRVIGRIHAHKIQLCATAHVEGDILAEAFAVEAGAFFEGHCKHSDNPLGEEARKPHQITPQQPHPIQTGLVSLTPRTAT